ncbi:MAG: hypothetical protein CMF61_08220 [Magnetococcales bacterium]|nr:hypothetical protein [Magnetococcales bacterium]|tara:strand:- start:1765 stop:2025 length:261 start_codon:yes stop_codon:yes gene_type:complete
MVKYFKIAVFAVVTLFMQNAFAENSQVQVEAVFVNLSHLSETELKVLEFEKSNKGQVPISKLPYRIKCVKAQNASSGQAHCQKIWL